MTSKFFSSRDRSQYVFLKARSGVDGVQQRHFAERSEWRIPAPEGSQTYVEGAKRRLEAKRTLEDKMPRHPAERSQNAGFLGDYLFGRKCSCLVNRKRSVW